MSELNFIGQVHTDFPEKFGLPRQSGLVNSLCGRIEFYFPYSQPESFKGLEEYEYIWILFYFHKAVRDKYSATVKPPKLGGNKSMGVFATRSPFRPNNIGMTCAKLERIECTSNTVNIYVSGIDLLDGTPVIDIKPYLPYADAHPDAKAGFTEDILRPEFTIEIDDTLLEKIPEEKRKCLFDVLKQDPRPGYQDDGREYGMSYSNLNIRFTIKDNIIKINDVNEK